jgi:HEAT repeat protein
MDNGQNDEIEQAIAELTSEDSETRMRAVQKLYMVKDTRVIEPLIAAINDSDPEVSEEAADSLEETVGWIGEAALEPLRRTVDHENPDVRMAVVRALGRIGEYDSVAAASAYETLLRCFDEESDPEVRKELLPALGMAAIRFRPYQAALINSATKFLIDALQREKDERVRNEVADLLFILTGRKPSL